MRFQIGITTQRNILMAVLGILTLNAIPMTAKLIGPLLSTPLPIPIVETVGGAVGLVGVVVLYWIIDKQV